jgi:hypothetical protein
VKSAGHRGSKLTVQQSGDVSSSLCVSLPAYAKTRHVSLKQHTVCAAHVILRVRISRKANLVITDTAQRRRHNFTANLSDSEFAIFRNPMLMNRTITCRANCKLIGVCHLGLSNYVKQFWHL